MTIDDHHAPKAAAIHRMAGELGFALVGVASAQATEHRQFIEQWVADGHHGQMDYLAKNLAVRLDPKVLLPGARSVICVADVYGPAFGNNPQARQDDDQGKSISNPGDAGADPTGRIARYAWGDDYHKVIKKRLLGAQYS